MLKQETLSSTTHPLQLEHVYMETLTEPRSRFLHLEHFAVSGNSKLVGEWQHGIETISGKLQWKLHLTLAHSPSPAFATVNYCQQP